MIVYKKIVQSKYTLIFIFLISVVATYLISQKFESELVRNKEKVKQVSTNISETESNISKWKTDKSTIEKIIETYPTEDLYTSILSFAQHSVDYSKSNSLVLSDIKLDMQSIEVSPNPNLVKINTQVELMGNSVQFANFLNNLKDYKFCFPKDIETEISTNKVHPYPKHKVNVEIWALIEKPVGTEVKSPQDILNSTTEELIKTELINKFSDLTTYKKILEGENVEEESETPTQNITVDGFDQVSMEGLNLLDVNKIELQKDDNTPVEPNKEMSIEELHSSIKDLPTKDLNSSLKPSWGETTKPVENVKPVENAKLPIQGKVLSGFSEKQNGVKIEAKFNANVQPIEAGKVIKITKLPDLGNIIIIEHPNGRVSLYGLLNNINVKENENVTKSTVIGTVGLDKDNVPKLYYSITGINSDLFVDPLQ